MLYNILENSTQEMTHQGYSLRLFIEGGHALVNDLARDLEISRQGVNGLYGQVSLDKSFVEKLRHKGYKIPGITAPGGAEIFDSDKKSEYEKQLEMQREIINTQKELIESLRSKRR